MASSSHFLAASHNISQHQRQQNVVSLLASREYNHRTSNIRKNHRILRTLVCGDNYEYRKVWEKTSKSSILFEHDKIFMDRYHTVYDGYGARSVAPIKRLSISKRKIMDMMFSQPSLAEIQTSPTGRPGCKLYAITNNSLVVIDYISGQVLFEASVHLPGTLSLKEIEWSKVEESLMISTIHYPYQPRGQRSGSAGMPNIVKVLALFTIQPLAFVCMFEVTRSVFGKDVTDAKIKEGMLLTMHRNGHVRYYDFDHLVEMHQISPQVLGDSGAGESLPLDINMQIKELPCELFQTKSEDNVVEMGANPWHYLISSAGSGTQHYFAIHSLESGLIAQNGKLTSTRESIEVDRAVFHPDGSNRIIHISSDEVRVLWVKQEDGKSCLTPDFTIPVLSQLQSNVYTPTAVTSSGRRVKQRFSPQCLYNDTLTIHGVCYEDELDLMSVSSTLYTSNCIKVIMGLYNNTTGDLLKSIELDEPTMFILEHNTVLNLDTVIQVTKYCNSISHVQVYRLFEKCAPDEFRQHHKPLVSRGRGVREMPEQENYSPPQRRRRQER